jgi:hypothetical protein
LFYSNFEILWKLWNFWKFWNFLKILKCFENFEILWNFLTYWLAKRNFCAITNHIAPSCHVISFIDFARECNMYMLSGCELIDTENISLPSQNMKFVGEWAKRTSLKLHILLIRLIFSVSIIFTFRWHIYHP